MPRTVLIAEDSLITRRLLEHYLSKAGYAVIQAGDGIEALGALLSAAPPIVLTDLEMPRMDGLELCRRIRAQEGIGFTYVIMLTAHDDMDKVVEAFDAGADDFVHKPFDPRELLARLRAGERIVDLEQSLARKSLEIYRYSAELECANQRLSRLNQRLDQLATTDELTQIGNRRAAMNALADLWDDLARSAGSCVCIMLDIDNFKRLNDEHGHDAGDLVLRQVAAVLRRETRGTEQVYRLGGEEFLIFIPSGTIAVATVVAERVREAIERFDVQYREKRLKVTASFGVAERTASMVTHDHLLKTADVALYDAKKSGRNCVRVAPPELRRSA